MVAKKKTVKPLKKKPPKKKVVNVPSHTDKEKPSLWTYLNSPEYCDGAVCNTRMGDIWLGILILLCLGGPVTLVALWIWPHFFKWLFICWLVWWIWYLTRKYR